MQRINHRLLKDLQQQAAQSERDRKILNFHKKAADPLQRMVNCIKPGSYVPPHKHQHPEKREVFILITGRLLYLEFDDKGEINGKTILDRDKGEWGVEITPGRYHTIIALEENTCVYEVKDGPYDPETDKNMAPWAPEENAPKAQEFLRQLLEKSKSH